MQNCFNNRPHAGLFYSCPIKVFYDSHTACIVARKNSKAYRQHQTKSKSIYATLKEHQKFQIGDFVLLKLKPKPFRKESSVFYPRWTSKKYRIKDIHYDHHPLLYSIEHFPNKKFYGWELQKSPEHYLTSSNPEWIHVKDIEITDMPVLRSGRSLPNSKNIVYIIEKSGLEQRVSSYDLEFFKKILGSDCLRYSDAITNDQEKNKYMI